MRYLVLGLMLMGCASSEPLMCEVGGGFGCGDWHPTRAEINAVCMTPYCGSGGRAICSRDAGLNFDVIACTNRTLSLMPYTP